MTMEFRSRKGKGKKTGKIYSSPTFTEVNEKAISLYGIKHANVPLEAVFMDVGKEINFVTEQVKRTAWSMGSNQSFSSLKKNSPLLYCVFAFR